MIIVEFIVFEYKQRIKVNSKKLQMYYKGLKKHKDFIQKISVLYV